MPMSSPVTPSPVRIDGTHKSLFYLTIFKQVFTRFEPSRSRRRIRSQNCTGNDSTRYHLIVAMFLNNSSCPSTERLRPMNQHMSKLFLRAISTPLERGPGFTESGRLFLETVSSLRTGNSGKIAVVSSDPCS